MNAALMLLVVLLVAGCAQDVPITTFEECVAAGHPVMESYPRQCAVPGGQTFVEELDADSRAG